MVGDDFYLVFPFSGKPEAPSDSGWSSGYWEARTQARMMVMMMVRRNYDNNHDDDDGDYNDADNDDDSYSGNDCLTIPPSLQRLFHVRVDIPKDEYDYHFTHICGIVDGNSD